MSNGIVDQPGVDCVEDSSNGRSDQLDDVGLLLLGARWADYRDQNVLKITASEEQLLACLTSPNPKAKMSPGPLPHPTKRKIRPNSAAAKLQTHHSYYTPLVAVARPATASVVRTDKNSLPPRPVTQAGAFKNRWISASDTQATDVKQPRRLTLGTVEGLSENQVAESRPRPNVEPVSEQLKSKIEEKINIDTLEELKKAFAKADVDKSGKLDLDEFKLLLKSQLTLTNSKENQIDALFMKIDWSSEGGITWDEFCTYMQLEYAEKEDSYLRAKEVSFYLPAKVENIPHRDPVLRITDTSDGTFVACSQDGMVSFWSGNLDLKRTRSVVNADQSNRQKPKWITDFVIMPHYNKFIVGTGDREIQFFELSSFEPYCQISGLETVPLKLDYCSTGHDECLILYGDSQGCINILVIQSAGECLRMWKKMPKHDGFIASISLDAVANSPNVQFIRWNVHGDWVQMLKYYHEIGQVISCCNHANSALVIGCTTGSTHVEQQLKEVKDPSAADKSKQKMVYAYGNTKTRLEADQSVFKVYKGVKCFDFSKEKNIIVTGGMDRIVRLWNPYVSGKPTAMLRGHNAPIFYLFISEEENRIFSISTDKSIKVWDIQDHNCLLTIRPKGHKIRGDLQALHYSSVSKALAVATDQMSVLSLRLKPILHADIVITHKEPINCCSYNPGFKQVVTCCEGSVIKIWDFETGAAIFEFGDAHGDSAITCMTFDNTGRRLLTGGRDGYMRVWNYNNGHCLRIFKREDGNEEICDTTYVEMNRNRYVITVGWDRNINIYNDTQDGSIHHVQHPLPRWADDEKRGHTEDILSIAQCPPNLLATASYDGQVVVWNLISGHIFCHLHGPAPEKYQDESMDGDLSINKLLFINSRAYKKDSASLISSGPRGHIHFWNVFHGGSLMAQFPGTRHHGAMVSAMDISKEETHLYTADNLGFVSVWNIAGYCDSRSEPNPPELVTTWRGHVETISSLQLVQDYKVLLTSSHDCTVRLWTTDGEYIGTFGQSQTWDLRDPSTFEHPMVPYDVLIDPLSLPSHPVFDENDTPKESMKTACDVQSKEVVKARSPSPPRMYGRNQFFVDDNTIAEQLKEKPFSKGTGKRLRHEKMKPVKIDRGGPSEYQMLRCYDLVETPQPEAPSVHVNKDPFDFYGD